MSKITDFQIIKKLGKSSNLPQKLSSLWEFLSYQMVPEDKCSQLAESI